MRQLLVYALSNSVKGVVATCSVCMVVATIYLKRVIQHCNYRAVIYNMLKVFIYQACVFGNVARVIFGMSVVERSL